MYPSKYFKLNEDIDAKISFFKTKLLENTNKNTKEGFKLI
jgi:hypothetical protein